LAALRPSQSDDEVRHLYRLMDKSNDGMISLAEFQNALLVLGFDDDTTTALLMFEEVDTNHSGLVTEDELVA
jgi:Ca2+-binding EF-hand superfamily protein